MLIYNISHLMRMLKTSGFQWCIIQWCSRHLITPFVCTHYVMVNIVSSQKLCSFQRPYRCIRKCDTGCVNYQNDVFYEIITFFQKKIGDTFYIKRLMFDSSMQILSSSYTHTSYKWQQEFAWINYDYFLSKEFCCLILNIFSLMF